MFTRLQIGFLSRLKLKMLIAGKIELYVAPSGTKRMWHHEEVHCLFLLVFCGCLLICSLWRELVWTLLTEELAGRKQNQTAVLYVNYVSLHCVGMWRDIYNSAASFIPENLHVCCVFKSFRTGFCCARGFVFTAFRQSGSCTAQAEVLNLQK